MAPFPLVSCSYQCYLSNRLAPDPTPPSCQFTEPTNVTVGDGDVLKSAEGPELLFIPADVNGTENGKLVKDRVWHPLLEKHHSASSSGGFLGLGNL